ncbi:MAG: hypothetical protein D6784_12060 [Chloroflexi bacterium]|nr:MAG: hypothetical protein D6784_12060 [Chloroflexota bacterium]
MVRLTTRRRRTPVAIIIFLLTAWLVSTASAQESIRVVNSTWTAEFRQHITFTAQFEAAAEITEVNLFYRIVGRPAASRNDADFTPGTSVTAEFVLDQTKPENYLPPGTELEYWWKITTADGNQLKTERETILYLDNRYDWQTLENERLTLYWYEGGDSFGQRLFDRANEALDTLETDFGIKLEKPIRIFIYANHGDLLGAISTASQEWTGGQAFPDYGVVVIGISPSQLDWGLDATTHEMTHLVVHQATDNPYGDLPRWLDEGIAVYNENRDQLDEDFRGIFEAAVKQNALMTLRTLSSPFPADPLKANLAYGQSGAVVKFIIDEYGPEAMAKLLDIFAEGALYDEALQEALGVDTDGLDNAFRASLGLPPLPGTADAAAEAPAVPAEDQPAGEAQPGESAAEAGQEPAPAGEPAGTPPTPAPAPPEPAPQTAPLGLPCLAGLLPVLALGMVWYTRQK